MLELITIAQAGSPPGETAADGALVLATVAAFGVVVKFLVSAIRRQWARIQGTYVQALAAGLGIVGAATFDLRATEALLEVIGASVNRIPHPIGDYIITGIAIAAASGFFHDRDPEPTPIIEVDAAGNPVI